MKVFVGGSGDEWLAARVLEFSIRETSSVPVEVRSIESFGRAIPTPLRERNQARTPFSFQRFLIPELCQDQGRAIYLDADMLVFSDIAALWEMHMDEHDLLTVDAGDSGRTGQYSVMLLDCARLAWRIENIVSRLDAGIYSYEQLMHGMCVAGNAGRTIESGWNSMERYDPASTRLLHYTDMNTQPWVATSNPLAHLWVACLRRATASGFIDRKALEREVTVGHVRPTLLAQIDASLDDPASLPRELSRLDRNFVAPYRGLVVNRWSRWASMPTVARMLLRGSRRNSK